MNTAGTGTYHRNQKAINIKSTSIIMVTRHTFTSCFLVPFNKCQGTMYWCLHSSKQSKFHSFSNCTGFASLPWWAFGCFSCTVLFHTASLDPCYYPGDKQQNTSRVLIQKTNKQTSRHTHTWYQDKTTQTYMPTCLHTPRTDIHTKRKPNFHKTTLLPFTYIYIYPI